MKITKVHYAAKQKSSQETATAEQDATLRFPGPVA